VNNQVESLQRITAQQQETLKDLLSANNVSASEAKLPQLDLKPFRGRYAQWSEFYDTFKCAIFSACPETSIFEIMPQGRSCCTRQEFEFE